MRLHQDLSLFSQMQYLNRPGISHETEATSWNIIYKIGKNDE